MHDLVIIGGGPAALAAARYARTKDLDIRLVSAEVGGKAARYVRHAAVDPRSDPPGVDLLRALITDLSPQTAWILEDSVVGIAHHGDGFAIGTRLHGTLSSRVVLLATGAEPRSLNLPGAERLIHRGLGYSITTYAHLLTGQRVAIIGVTDRALRGTLELARYAEHVYLIAPALRDHRHPLVATILQHPQIEVLDHASVSEIIGQERVEELIVVESVPARSHAYDQMVSGGGVARHLNVQHVFADMGLSPLSAMVRDLVSCDPDGFVDVDRNGATRLPGLFAAGDVTTARGEQIVIAMGDGTRAAVSAYDMLLASPTRASA